MVCASPTNLRKDIWYYLYLVPEYHTPQSANSPKQLNLTPVNLLYDDEPSFAMPGSFVPNNHELQKTTDGGKSKVWGETKSQDLTTLFEPAGPESKVGEQPSTSLPLSQTTVSSLLRKEDFTTYKQCK